MNIILDFNGTLLDDVDVCLKILNILCKENNLPPVSKKYYMDIFEFPVINYYLKVGFTKKDFETRGSEFHIHYNKLSPTEAKLFDDVIPFLNYLKEKGHRILCLSASLQDTLVNQLKYYGIYNYFDDILGLDNSFAYSKEKMAINYFNSHNINRDDSLFIGDSIHDLEVANAINVKCYLVATGHTAKYRLLKVTNNVFDSLSEIRKVL